MKSTIKKPVSCKLLIFLQVFLGLGAVFGGGAFIIDPSGELIRMPITLLEPSPFTNYLIPGVILFVILGILPLVIAYGLVTRKDCKIAALLNIFQHMHWAWTFSLYMGFTLIIWISVQMYLINLVETVHLVYIGLGLLIQAVSLLPSVQKFYEIK